MDTAPNSAPPSNSELLAELEAGAWAGDAAKTEKAEAKPDETKADESTETETAADDAEQVEAKTDEDEQTEESDDTDEESDDADPQTAKGLEQVRRNEQRMRAELAKERAEVERLRAEHAEDIKALREFQQLKQRRDVVGLARALGFKESDFEDLSLSFYAETEKGKADPRYKVKVEQSARERAQAEELAELRKRLDERDQRERESQQQAEVERATKAYVDGIAKAITAKAPLAAAALKADANLTRSKLSEVAFTLWQATGEQPSAVQVVKAFEKQIERERKYFAALGTSAPTNGNAPKAAPAKPGTTAANGAANSNGASKTKVTDDEILAELQSGKLH